MADHRLSPTCRPGTLRPAPSARRPKAGRRASAIVWPEVYEVVVKCGDERHQRTLYHRLTAEGLKCRLVVL